jgi:hypothetical protein
MVDYLFAYYRNAQPVAVNSKTNNDKPLRQIQHKHRDSATRNQESRFRCS